MIRSQRSAARLTELAELCAAGKLKVRVRRTFPLEEAAAAHRELASGHGQGKVVLMIG
ncbi:zinc-binding dehydrogenase [Paenibacillus favisporus]|uniref:zinc-binding dehydrogenase n=1 Tax=Paenibacillus favisporus TaxID=221028 RepID=UPI002DBE408D|nr:zinc-binding dehydrogenase [Paenibacillus favisporus]MEC0179303.1 zinc-binding dehydrogenase [Paenibacillus favisporus]